MGRKSEKKGAFYISIPLNALAIGVALGGFVLPLATQSPQNLVEDAQSMLAASGSTLSAEVPPNPYSDLAQQLDQKEQALNQREEALSQRASALSRPSIGEIFGFISFALSIILFVLLGVNFYFDSRRSKRPSFLSTKFSVDLR